VRLNVIEESLMSNFNYASTSEEFSTIAEDQNGEEVREVAEAQEASENEQETKDEDHRPSTPQNPNENWEVVNEPE
jgi:hypothetical protein